MTGDREAEEDSSTPSDSVKRGFRHLAIGGLGVAQYLLLFLCLTVALVVIGVLLELFAS
jgi:hypothetical protein